MCVKEEPVKHLIDMMCNVDMKLFKKQKKCLASINPTKHITQKDIDYIDGVLNLLDHIGDWIEDNPEAIFEHKL